MKAAKVNNAAFVYPEYLMLCKLVRRMPNTSNNLAYDSVDPIQ